MSNPGKLNPIKSVESIWNSELLAPLFLTLSVLVLKWVSISPSFSPVIFDDSNVYVEYSRDFASLRPYELDLRPGVLSAPLYPLVLAAGLFFDNFYTAMKLINVAVSSLVIPCAWLLARHFLDRRWAFAAVVLIAILPSTHIYTPHLMAENIGVPLFLLCCWLSLVAPKSRFRWSFFHGVATGALMMSKFTFLPSIPLFLAFRFAVAVGRDGNWAHGLRALATSLMALILTLSPWIAYGHLYSGIPLGELFGIGLATATPQSKPIVFAVLMIMAFGGVLVGSAPFLTAIAFGLASTSRAMSVRRFDLVVFAVFAACIGAGNATMVALISYQWVFIKDVSSIMSITLRHATYFFPLVPVLAIAMLQAASPAELRRPAKLAVAAILYAALLAFMLGYQNEDLPRMALAGHVPVPDAFYLQYPETRWLPLASASTTLVIGVLWSFNRLGKIRDWPRAVAIGSILVALIQYGMPSGQLLRGSTEWWPLNDSRTYHARQIAMLTQQRGLNVETCDLEFDQATRVALLLRLQETIQFWRMEEVLSGATGIKPRSAYALPDVDSGLVEKSTATDCVITVGSRDALSGPFAATYEIGDAAYAIKLMLDGQLVDAP